MVGQSCSKTLVIQCDATELKLVDRVEKVVSLVVLVVVGDVGASGAGGGYGCLVGGKPGGIGHGGRIFIPAPRPGDGGGGIRGRRGLGLSNEEGRIGSVEGSCQCKAFDNPRLSRRLRTA